MQSNDVINYQYTMNPSEYFIVQKWWINYFENLKRSKYDKLCKFFVIGKLFFETEQRKLENYSTKRNRANVVLNRTSKFCILYKWSSEFYFEKSRINTW